MLTLIVLFVSLLVFRGLGVLGVPLFLTWHDSALCALSVMVLFTASAHFTSLKEDLIKMVPSFFPAPRQIIFATGLLEIAGAVAHPMRLSMADLMQMARTDQRVDHFCVEGWNARAQWIGTRVSELAKAAGVTADAHYVDFQSFDSDYHESWDMASAMHPQTLVAYAMDGRYLGAGHGAPARLHSPIKLGYKNTKYLTRVVFMPARNGGYWTDRGYEWYGGT